MLPGTKRGALKRRGWRMEMGPKLKLRGSYPRRREAPRQLPFAAAPVRWPENNTFFAAAVRGARQFIYIHKSVHGSSAFA